MTTEARGAVDLNECPRLNRSGMQNTHNCYCVPACAVCGFGKHMAVHGPEYGNSPGSRPWHHEYQPGDGTPDYSDDNAWSYREHPRQGWSDR